MANLKIAIDTAPLHSGHAARGMGMYTKNLIEHLEKKTGNNKTIKIDAFLFKDNKEKLKNYDVAHYPYFDLFWHTLPLNKATKTIVTIPDVIPLLYPQYYPPGIKGRLKLELQKTGLRQVDRVVTISETSKKDIIRMLSFDPEKIDVTYLAPNFKTKKVSKDLLAATRLKYGLPDEFILYIGDVNWNKNIVRLCEAAESLEKTLVIVGKQAVEDNYDKNHIENKPLDELQSRFGSNKYIKCLGFVENADLNNIWQLTSVYCQPALYEGFGLPVLEAMDAGVPVVASQTQAISEIAGNAAVFFDPYSMADLKAKLKKVLSSNKIKQEYIKKGSERVKEFSWEKTAKATLESYIKVLK